MIGRAGVNLSASVNRQRCYQRGRLYRRRQSFFDPHCVVGFGDAAAGSGNFPWLKGLDNQLMEIARLCEQRARVFAWHRGK